MSLVKKIKKSLHGIFGFSNFSFGPLIRESFSGAWQSNITLRNETAIEHFAVYSCMSLIANDIGKLPFLIKRLTKDNVWKTVYNRKYRALQKLLDKPNSYQNHLQFKVAWIFSLFTGNTYVLLVRDRNGEVVEMHVLDPQRVQVLCANDGSVFYRLSNDKLSGIAETQVTVPASDVIHDRINPIFHPLCGVSPLVACSYSIYNGMEIQKSSHDFFKNNSRPGGLLIAPEAIDQEDAKELKRAWTEEFTGSNSGKIAVLGNDLKFQQLNISAADSQLIEQLKFGAEAVCAVFHVPMYMVFGNTVGGSVESLAQQYYGQCLQSYIQNMEECLYNGLGLEEYEEQICIDLDLSPLLRMDTAARYKSYSDGIGGGWMTPNEARLKEDLEPVTGGDTVYLQQQNFSLEALSKRDAREDPFAPATKPTPDPTPTPEPEVSEEEEDNTQEEIAKMISIFNKGMTDEN